jgi:hypothetical protein
VANSQDRPESQHPDLLAGVALHTLVSRGREGMTVADVARACERDPEDMGDAQEVAAAVQILVEDGLAERLGGRTPGEHLLRPTRAAVRAQELSF